MPRYCGRCRRPPRFDDGLQFTQTNPAPSLFGGSIDASGGTITEMVCRDCLGEPAPAWPKGRTLTFPICGLCRLALYENESIESQRIRLAEEDSEHEPGAYVVCRACLEIYRPIIHRRLLLNPPADANGTGRQRVPVFESFVGDWLL